MELNEIAEYFNAQKTQKKTPLNKVPFLYAIHPADIIAGSEDFFVIVYSNSDSSKLVAMIKSVRLPDCKPC